MSPAEGGMGVDDDVLVFFGQPLNFLENRSPQGVESADGQVEDAAIRHVGGFLVHHPANVEDLDIQALLESKLFDGFEIGPLVDAHLSGHYCAHGFSELKRRMLTV